MNQRPIWETHSAGMPAVDGRVVARRSITHKNLSDREIRLTNIMRPVYALDRDERDACERSTVGCCINHSECDNECETW